MKSPRLSPHAARRLAPHPVARAARELLGPAGAALMLGLVPLPAAWAGPQGGQVSAGQASIQVQGATTTVQQTSARAAIDWQSFSVGAHETVRFQQPSAAAVVLNRVVGPDPSAIFGRITANGQVLLINPNGILFGRGAQVDVGGLVASTANVSNADFMAGRLAFTQPGRPGAAVVNEGRITVADGGLAALVGRTVANRGVIEARLGTVALAGGDAFVLDLYGDRLVNLVVDPAALATLTDAQGVPLAARVDQQGRIHADGGVVQLAAATVSRLVDSLINVGGTVRATSFEQQPGRIVLRGDEGTRLNLAGSVDVSGVHGGRIEATAGKVQLASTARLDASGDLGGGHIAVGGDWQGQGALPNAQQVDVAKGAQLDASARRQGDGGTVVVWSDGDTRFDGRIAARGGAGGGDGGQVEVSGRQRLGFDGDVVAAAGAAGGRAGMLLLDPQNLVIDSASGSSTLPGVDTPGDYTVRAAAVNRQLVNGTSVTLQATQDLTLTTGTVLDARATSGATPGAGLTLTAGRDIALDGLVILTDGAFTATVGGRFTQAAGGAVATGSGAIAVTAAGNVAASNLLSSGAVTLRSTAGSVNVSRAVSGLAGRGGALTIEGRDGVTLGAGALVGAATLTSAQGAVDTSAATLDAGGAITLAGASVATGALITPAAVTVNSAGAVSLGAVAGAAGEVNAQTAKAQGLNIATPGAVTLAGAALGAGGLTVHGATAGGRAGAVGLGAASIFSDGAVSVRASAITLAAAGIAGGGTLLLDAGGTLSTGSGKLQSAGAMTLAAGGAVTLGDGGAEAGAALAIDGGTLQLDGALRSTAALQLQAAQGIALNRNVNAASFAATAGAGFTQAAGSAVGAGAVTIASTGALEASNLIATGAVALSSSQGAVTVSGALASGADRTDRIASLQASGRNGVTLGGGALVAGTTTLSSAQGAVTTTAATLDSGGAVTINGASVSTGAVVTPATVTVTSAGAVSLGAVAAIDGTVGASSLPAEGLVVATPGVVTLSGAALGAGGLTVRGASAGLRAGAVGLGNASIFSAGDVVVDAASITLADAGIASGAALRLDASGTVASGAGKLQSAGAMTLVAGSSAAIGTGGAESTAGTLTVTGTALTLTGDLRSSGIATLSALQDLRVDGDIVAASLDATAGGRFVQAGPSKVAADSIEIAAAGGIAASNLLGSGAMRLGSSAGTVVVAEALSGAAGTRAGSLQVEGRDGVTLAKGALAGGTTTLNSSAGAISLGATLDSGGGITLQGASVTAMALLSSGDVAVTSTGAVTLGGVAGEAGAINATRAKARGLLVATPGSVTLAGAALDSGGLGVRGANAGDRAGAVTFGDGSVFSDGAVRVDATTITLGAAGVAGGGTLTLDASAALTTGAGAVQGAGAVALSAGGDLSVGSGGARSTGSTLSLSGDALSVTGAQGLAGALGSAGAMTLSAARGITLDANVAAGGFTATAGTTFDQGASRSIDAGAGGLDITVAGELATGTLLAAGAVRLQSTQGAVNVRGAVGGAGDARVASLRVDGLDGVTLHAGARVAGTTELTSTGGAVTTSAATLDSRGDITLQGASVTTAALLSAGTVTADSAGAIVLGGVAGEAGEINENRDKAAGLVVRTLGAVTLGGAALGAGGLSVGGASPGDRAGDVDFGSAGVFSGGEVQVDAASIAFSGSGGLKTGGVLRLDAAGDVGSAGGALVSDAAATIAAGSVATLGLGGVSAGGALSITAATVSASGPLRSNGTMQLQSTNALTLGGNVQAASFSANAGGAFDHDSTAALSADTITITSETDLTAGRLVSSGDISLTSNAGQVIIHGSISGGSSSPAASLAASGRDGVTIGGDVLVQGTTDLVAALGNIDTSAATLDSTGAITLRGTSVSTGALLSRATIDVESSGDITLGVVAGAAGDLTPAIARAEVLRVATPGAITLGGAAVGSGGLVVGGATTGTRAAAVNLRAASIYSNGDVRVDAASIDIGTGAGIAGGAAVVLDASDAIVSADKLLDAQTTLQLRAGTTLSIGGGGARAAGDLTLQATGDVTAAGPLKTRGATVSVTSVSGSVTLDEVFTWEAGVGDSGRLAINSALDVTLTKALGGTNTGYGSAVGYRPESRPNLGAVEIVAGRDVELNGLNLDGQTNAASSSDGLSVRAGHRIVSNAPIAVNKGSIRLVTAGTADVSGIYLGNYIYSRGHDSDGTANNKTGYAIELDAASSRLVLFDRTTDYANVPYEFGSPYTREIAKVIVGNNVDNYHGTASGTVVEASTILSGDLTVTVKGELRAVSNWSGAALRLSAMPTAGDLLTADVAQHEAGIGIGLKLQTFAGQFGDFATADPIRVDDLYIHPNTGACYAQTFEGCSVEARIASGDWNAPSSPLPGTENIRYVYNNSITGGTGTTYPGFHAYKFVQPGFLGQANLNIPNVPWSFYTLIVEDLPIGPDSSYNPAIGLTYAIGGRIVQTNTPTPQMLIYPGLLQSEFVASTFNATNGLNIGDTANTNTGPGRNSNPGFNSIGAFGGQGSVPIAPPSGGTGGAIVIVPPGASTALPATGGSSGDLPFGNLQVGNGVVNNGNSATVAPGFGGLELGSAAAGAGNAASTNVGFGGLVTGAAVAGAGNGFALPPASAGDTAAQAPSTLRPGQQVGGEDSGGVSALVDIVIGSRPAALADLGRGSASSGSAPNVLRKRFRLAIAADESVCAPGDLQPAGGASNRLCPPDR